jgi:hypothetical protein
MIDCVIGVIINFTQDSRSERLYNIVYISYIMSPVVYRKIHGKIKILLINA